MERQEVINSWKENNELFYEYIYENNLDWPCTSCQWGPIVETPQQSTIQKVYFSCKSGGITNDIDSSSMSSPLKTFQNYVVVANVDIPNQNYYFINELRALFNYDQSRKYPNLKIKNVIVHPGEANVIRTFPANRKILATKNDINQVFIWTPEKHKGIGSNNTMHNPDITLLVTPNTSVPNFSLVFAPTLPRVMTTSGVRLEFFDLQGAPVRRQLGSVLSSNVIAPMISLDIAKTTPNPQKEKIQDIAFKDKNNQLLVTGGHGRRLALWDLRLNSCSNSIEDVHDGDINCLSWKGHYIISGGSDKRVVITDERKPKTPVYSFENKKEVLSMHWNTDTNHFAVGGENLSLYSFEEIENQKKLNPVFTHFGMRGPINDFDWNSDSHPWNIISTCLEPVEMEGHAVGGSLHMFRPLDLLHMPKEKAIARLEKALQKMPEQVRSKYV